MPKDKTEMHEKIIKAAAKEFLEQGFENASLHSIASTVGIRESRRIRGKVYQTVEDFHNCAKYPDGIARCQYPIDIHNPNGGGDTCVKLPKNEYYEIRYGALVAADVSNLLMGCRAISVDHALHSSIRIMPCMCSIGQAAGMGAAYMVQNNCQAKDIDGVEIRRRLIAAGANLA